jgi:hypothetical protein
VLHILGAGLVVVDLPVVRLGRWSGNRERLAR